MKIPQRISRSPENIAAGLFLLLILIFRHSYVGQPWLDQIYYVVDFVIVTLLLHKYRRDNLLSEAAYYLAVFVTIRRFLIYFGFESYEEGTRKYLAEILLLLRSILKYGTPILWLYLIGLRDYAYAYIVDKWQRLVGR